MAKNSKANYSEIRAELNRARMLLSSVSNRNPGLAMVAIAETKGIIQALDNLFKDAR